MKEVSTRNIHLVTGIILLALGGIVLTGWFFDIHFLTDNAPIFCGVLSLIFSGLFFITKRHTHTTLLKNIPLIFGLLVLLNSLMMTGFCLSNFYPLSYFFQNSQFTQYYSSNSNLLPHIAWMIAGFLMCCTTYHPNLKYLSYLEIANFVLLFIAIQGIVLTLHQFELVYTWLNTFAMPLPYAIGLAIVNIGMIIIWGDIRSSNTSHGIEENNQIKFFSVSMLTQAILSSIFFGAMMLASQNELFLKNSLEKYAELKTLILNETLNNEIDEVKRTVKTIESKLTTHKISHLSEKKLQDLSSLFAHQDYTAVKLSTVENTIILNRGTLTDNYRDAINVNQDGSIKLIHQNHWSLAFKVPIRLHNKIIGFMELEKQLHNMANIAHSNNNFSLDEIQVICSQDSSNNQQCLSSEDRKWSMNSFNLFAPNTSIGTVFVNNDRNNQYNVTVVESLKNTILRFAVLIDSGEIEKNLQHKMWIALPIIGLFILFFIKILNWHILPIFRKFTNAEKDAIDSARMVSDSESRIRTIIDNIGECVIVFSDDGKIDSMNQVALSTFNMSENSIRDTNLNTLFNIPTNEFHKYLYISYGQWREGKCYRLDGTAFDAHIKFKDIRTRQKNLFIAIIRDITNQKTSESKLIQSEKVLRSSFDHSPIGMMVLNMKNRITQVNQALCTMLGYHESELIGQNLKALLPENLRQENSLPFQKLAEIGIKNYKIESPMLTKSGQIIQTISSMTLFLSQNEEDSFFIAQIQDITMRQLYETELQQKNDELESKFKELKNHTRITEELNKMNSILQACLTTSETLNPIEKFADKLFDNIQGAVYLTTPENNSMELVLRWGKTNNNISSIKKDDCWSLRRSQVYTVTDLHDQVTCYHYANVPLSGQICIPLTAQGELIGLMTLYSEDINFNETYKNTRRLALSFADHIALSLSNIRLRERLQHQSIVDALTNLYNRRYFDESIKIELSRAERKKQNLSLLIVDIDHFKNFNDTYGHDVGDIVLQEVSHVLTRNIRSSDIACRMGGEEFAIILPETSTSIAHERAEMLRKKIEKLIIKNTGKSIDPITASIGIATYPEHANTTKNLIEAADVALYAAKNQGRNRCITATALTTLASLTGKTKSPPKPKQT
ncbi:MAG: diguanylate cyclase [Candidatus Paracaedibacteraceae bacterium]|nr:diguanylate cyclase [Candidatus Paracaedibacteraceae bacterium]